MKTKTIPSRKKLRSTKTLKFVKREYVVRYGLTETRDCFLHEETGITVVRELLPTTDSNYVRWTCPELGGGVANLAYWIRLAKANPRRRHG